MTSVRRRNNPFAEFEASGFGPDNLSYSEALAKEWARQPALPDNTLVKGTTRTRKPRKGVSRINQRRYDGALTRLPSPTQEGIQKMARGRAAAAAETEEEETELDLTAYATKAVTVVGQAYAEWLTEETGYEADERTVYMAIALRRKFQHDQRSRDRIAEIREERAEEAKASKATAAEGEGEKPKPRSRAKASTVTSSSSVVKPAATRGKTAAAGKAAAGGTTGPRPTAPRGRRGAAAAAKGGEAPF